MNSLFDEGEVISEALGQRLAQAYRARLLSNPPTPAFMPSNPKCEQFAARIAPKDVTRFLAVLAEMGLTIKEKDHG